MMKCPNCGKEALFVNGKYVCVDCGIEITPEQQAIQNQAADPMVGPAIPTDISEETPQIITNSGTEEAPAENAEPASESTPVATEAAAPEVPAEPAKPVQDYFENAIATEEPLTPEAKSGVYDFTNDATSPAEVPAESESIVEPEVVPVSSEATAETPAETPTYFAPATFDPNTVQPEAPVVESTVVEPEPEVAEPAPIEPVMPVEPVAETSNPALDIPVPTTEATPQVEAEAKTLDDMLGGTSVAAPVANDTISAYGPAVDGMQPPTTPEPTLTNVTTETAMPSVESVFGTNPPTPPTNEMPTAQDFGIAPPAPPQKKKIWPIVAIAAGAVLLIGGIIAALVLGSNNKTAAPVELDNTGIVELSNSVAAAMQPAQGISVNYNIRAQHTMNVTDGTKAGKVYEEYFVTPYDQTATWTTDTEGNITLESTSGTLTDKRTYISDESSTYIYSEKDKKYLKKQGLQLSSIPAVFGVEAKAATFYTTNIDKATKVGPEILDGVTYNKYEIVPNAELVSSTLASMGSVFNGATYESIDTTNVRLTAWLFPDGKIKKLALSGEVSVVTDKFNGKIALTGEATYTYETVTIMNPGAPPSETPATQEAPTAEEPQATNNEEGQPSSINTGKIPAKAEADPIVEAKG